MPDKHVQVARGWSLVRNKLDLTPIEKQHLRMCERCHYWLSGFTEMAKRAGFGITYTIPALEKKEKGATG